MIKITLYKITWERGRGDLQHLPAEPHPERFFWADGQDPLTYRTFRANGEGDARRSPREIPVPEAANAICRALEEQFSLPQEDLIRAAANLMGFARLGPAVSALFQDGIDWAEQEDRIGKTSNDNWVLKNS